MSEKSIEIRAPTVEEAIARGLETLGATRDEVEIEVVQQPSRGVLGLGAREAIVRLTRREAEEEPPENLSAEVPEPTSGLSLPEIEQIARETLQEILKKMGIEARVNVRLSEQVAPDEETSPLILDVEGDDLGILIGRRGETLAALQYITRLIVSREVQEWVNLVVDVEHYKARREQTLRQLAQRMAERVSLSRQPIALEPMPPYERRIIHLALRDHPVVTTQSVGKGDHRKVTIIPRR